jgi:U3 small nucleolar RNA-associated protein 12
MVKTYLKYQLKDVVGQISGKTCKICSSPDGKFIYTGCNEYVLVLNIKTGLVVHKIQDSLVKEGSKSQVTCVNVDETNSHLAVGYNSGIVVIYDIKNDYVQSKRFSLHKSAITSLQFNKNVNILASGSKDTQIFLWDIIGETVLYKLSGHKDAITKTMFYNVQFENFDEMEILISSSKDNTIKIWNIKNQETLQTIADLVHKVTDFLIYENILILGSFDQKLRLYQFSKKELLSGTKDTNYFIMKGFFTRQSSAKILTISISPDNKLISILSNDNSIEFVKILSPSELKRRLVKIEMEKNQKNEKKEKLLNKEKFNETSDKIKNLMEREEYNFKYLFYSLFKFIGEQKISSQIFLKNPLGLINNKNIWKFCLGLGNNSVEIYELNTSLIEQNIFIKGNNFNIEEKSTDEESLSVQKSFSVDNFGHREILRFVKISEKDNLYLTASNESVRLWNFGSLSVIKVMNLKNIISGDFILDDKYVRRKFSKIFHNL